MASPHTSPPSPRIARSSTPGSSCARRPLIDGHNDLPWAIRESEKAPRDVAAYDLRTRTPEHTDLSRLAQGQVGAQFWSIYIPGEIKDSGYARVQLEQFDIARRMIARYPDRLALALTADDIERELQAAAGSPRSSAWKAATPSRTRSARSAPTTISAPAT